MTESEKFGERIAKGGNAVLDFFSSDKFAQSANDAATDMLWLVGFIVGVVVITFIVTVIRVKKNQDKYR